MAEDILFRAVPSAGRMGWGGRRARAERDGPLRQAAVRCAPSKCTDVLTGQASTSWTHQARSSQSQGRIARVASFTDPLEGVTGLV